MAMQGARGGKSTIRIVVAVAATLGLVLIATACTSSTTSSHDDTPQWSWLGKTNTATQGGQIWGMSCASSSLCVAVGAYDPAGNPGHIGDSVTIFHGGTWSKNTLVGQRSDGCINRNHCALHGSGLYVVACAPNRFCMTTDTVSRSFIYSGTHWSETPLHYGLSPSLYQFTGTSVSCPSQAFCMAVNNIDTTDTFDGSTWGAPTNAFVGNVAPSRVWCRSAHFCVAFGSDGIHTYDGASWSTAATGAEPGLPQSWSCLLHTACMFSNGYTVPFVPGFGSAGGNVSCATRTFCMSVSGTHYYEYVGGHWSKPKSLPHGQAGNPYPQGRPDLMPQLSCVSSDFCLLVAPGGATWVWR